MIKSAFNSVRHILATRRALADIDSLEAREAIETLEREDLKLHLLNVEKLTERNQDGLKSVKKSIGRALLGAYMSAYPEMPAEHKQNEPHYIMDMVRAARQARLESNDDVSVLNMIANMERRHARYKEHSLQNFYFEKLSARLELGDYSRDTLAALHHYERSTPLPPETQDICKKLREKISNAIGIPLDRIPEPSV